MNKPLLLMFIGCCCSVMSVFADVPAERKDAVYRVLDQYMDALNQIDIEGHVATYHFPHFRLAGGNIAYWQTAAQAMPLLQVAPEHRAAKLREALHPEWHSSHWSKREIVQDSNNKVHVATRFVRQRADGSEIVSFDSLYILTLQDGIWGIKGRSSMAP